jgi:hypothetical protein
VNVKDGPGRKLGGHDKVISDRKRAANLLNAQCPGVGNPRYDADVRELISTARSRGARSLPDVIDDVVRIATTGYSRYVDPLSGLASFTEVEPETRLYAARFLGDRCGLPPRAETEVSVAESLPLTVIVMSEDVTQ